MTGTDDSFNARFTPLTINSFVTNQAALTDWTPTASQLNVGMMSDIGRATVYGPDTQTNFYARFMKNPLTRGDSVMTAKIKDISSRAYNPKAPDTDLFNGQYPEMVSNVAKKNFSRQIAVEVNDRQLKQFVQTQEMIGEAQAAIMAVSNACYLDDMWVASKAYFSGSTDGAQDKTQMVTMTSKVEDAGFGPEMTELLWEVTQRDFGYKSNKYNSSKVQTKTTTAHIALKKDVEYPAFKKLLSETFNPELLRVTSTIDYVDDFATVTAGAPSSGAGELIGMVVDTRAFEITPMPDTLYTESFRNPARGSTAYFTTYEYAFQKNPFFNTVYIFAPE